MHAKNFVLQVFERWAKGDITALLDALAPDVIWTARGTTTISGTYHGKENYLEHVYKPLLSAFEGPFSCQVQQIFSEGDMVAIEWHAEAPTALGSRYIQDYCWLIRVREDGRAFQEVTEYFDTALVNDMLAKSE